MSDNLYLCIHGHFYQPPRENPWLETIDYQDSAKPYHDWNERICAECYRPNGLSQILDDQSWVVRLTNNYSRMSFNFGPTLLSWLEEHDPQSYASVLEGDKKSQARFGGHGSAIAQAYNHIIMPLANRRDKETQVKWGLRDFEKRFGRPAEAMWLPETALCMETLEILADHGMKYVILAPRQAQAVRPLDGNHLWQSVRGERINTRKPYQITLPGDKKIAAFFYDGPISRAVAFEGLLNNGETFANRLYSGFDPSGQPQLLHIATDGESYGHHHLRGDMALAYALHYIEKREMATLTNYGQFLELFPPREEVQIYEHSSWSCIHGVERWRSDCGCNSGSHPAWHQKWRRPLREAMDFLRDRLALCYESVMEPYTSDAWEMRNDYINVVLDRSGESRNEFLKRWIPEKDLKTAGVEQVIFKALEMQRQLMLMYTSCAWFFDEISGVETVQGLQYAAKAIELCGELCDLEIEADFLRILENAPTNIPEFTNGKRIYEMFVLPARVDFLKVATHLGSASLFQDCRAHDSFACFDYTWRAMHRVYSGRAQLVMAHIEITSRLTREMRDMEIVALHLGDHNINVGALPFSGETQFATMVEDFTKVFSQGDIAKSLRLLDKYFEGHIYYLDDLLHDQQKEIVQNVFSQTLESLEDQFANIYQQHYPVMTYFSNSHIDLPQVFSYLAHFVQNKHIKNQLKSDVINFEEIRRYIQEAQRWGINLDAVYIENHYIDAVEAALQACHAAPGDLSALRKLNMLVEFNKNFPFPMNLERIQNSFSLWVYRNRNLHQTQSDEWKMTAENISRILRVHLQDRLDHE
jgi:alpha-amylase/alpha-mannosidase (GH57 family)